MIRALYRPGLFLLLALALAPAARAHALKVFAYAENGRIEGEVYFRGGAPVPGARVEIRDPAGELLETLRSDAGGGFGYDGRPGVVYHVLADSGDGHRAEWTLAGMAPDGGAGTEPDAAAAPLTAAAVEAAIARQVVPLRRELRDHDERIRLRDLLGGIGYILGLAGAVLWWRSRSGRPRRRRP